jgi:hypothetical protein
MKGHLHYDIIFRYKIFQLISSERIYDMMNNFAFVIPLLFPMALYVVGIVALVYLIKALRVYIKKNS